MRKRIFTPFRVLFVLVAIVVTTTSSIPTSKAPTPVTPEKAKAAMQALTEASKDGKVTYKELKGIATDLKGEKLTFKEKIALKLFGKKIANKVLAKTKPFDGDGKSQVVALILCGFIGCLGIHRFYLGYTWQGIVQLLTLGGCGIWALIDFIRICTGDLQPKDESYGKTL